MNLLLLLRKADEMGINGGLRLLVLSLVAVLLLLMTYYFLVINRSSLSNTQTKIAAQSAQKTEKQLADAALMNKIKSALAQTKRLHGYSIGVECREGLVALTGDVPTEIDKQLAADLAQEITGVKEVQNRLRVIPDATPQPGESKQLELSVNVEDLELQANLRERLLTVPELKAQKITLKVQNRQVTLTGQVATEAQKARAEELLRNYPKVAGVQNQLHIGSSTASNVAETAVQRPSLAATPLSQDAEIIRQVKAALLANRADFAAAEALEVYCQNGDVTLSGTVATRAERALAERLAKEVAGVREIKNILLVKAK
ncbi:MAG: BON domain-containing protein [Blastocatellia bacterium]